MSALITQQIDATARGNAVYSLGPGPEDESGSVLGGCREAQSEVAQAQLGQSSLCWSVAVPTRSSQTQTYLFSIKYNLNNNENVQKTQFIDKHFKYNKIVS